MGKGASKEDRTEEEPKRTPTLRQGRQESSSNEPEGTPTLRQGRQESSSNEPKRTPTLRQSRQESRSNDENVDGARVSKTVSSSHTTTEPKRTPTLRQGRQESSSNALMRTPTQPQGSQQSSSKDENVGGSRVRETASSSHTTTADDKSPLSELTIYSRKRSDALFVAVIDFGTTKTGFCYTTKDKPDKLHAYVNGRIGEQPEKFPTIVLLQPDKQFHSFGTEAVEKYQQLVEQNLHHNWYYFEGFKMKLHAREKPLTEDMEIDDILGKTMLAMDVFVAAIYFIRKKLLEDLEKISMALDTDVHWVLTVPAIWDDLSKQFMREAAERVGIHQSFKKESNLLLA